MTQKALLPWGQKFDFTRWNHSGHRLHSNVDKTAGVDLEKQLRWGLQLSSSTCLACTRPRSPSWAPHIHKMFKMTTLATMGRNSAYLLPCSDGHWLPGNAWSPGMSCAPLYLFPDPHSPHSGSDKWKLSTSSLGVGGKQGVVNGGRKERRNGKSRDKLQMGSNLMKRPSVCTAHRKVRFY